MNYNNQYIEYVEQYRRIIVTIVAVKIRRWRIIAILIMMHLLKKKKSYKKKKYWVVLLFENHCEHRFFSHQSQSWYWKI